MKKGAIVLCGGKSSRMGRDKATLPFGPELMLQRVVRIVSAAVDASSVIIVASPSQNLPNLCGQVAIVRDDRPYRGPLAGLAAGLLALPHEIDAIYATSCDVPLLKPDFVFRMFEQLGDSEIAVPYDGEHFHPLAAVYRPTVLPSALQLLAADELRPRTLFARVKTQLVPVQSLREVDPELHSLMNLNHLHDYQHALAVAGFWNSPQLDEIP